MSETPKLPEQEIAIGGTTYCPKCSEENYPDDCCICKSPAQQPICKNCKQEWSTHTPIMYRCVGIGTSWEPDTPTPSPPPSPPPPVRAMGRLLDGTALIETYRTLRLQGFGHEAAKMNALLQWSNNEKEGTKQ